MIRPITLVRAIRNVIDYEELATFKSAIDVIEKLTDTLVFDRADICRKELHRVADLMQNTVDRMEGF
jgi:hypothetical protein